MVRFYLALFFSLAVGSLQAQLILKEDFSNCGPLSNNGWTVFANENMGTINGCGLGLTYAGYAGSGIGNSAQIFQTNGEGVEHAAAADITGGSVYASFMAYIQNTSGNTNLVLNFNTNGTGNYQTSGLTLNNSNFGLSNNGAFTAANVSYNTFQTYLVVVELSNSTGAYSIYINPTIGGAKPGANATITPTGTKPTLVYGLRLHQNNVTNANIGGIRIGETWNDVVGTASGTGMILAETFPNGGGLSSNGWLTYYNCCSISTNGPPLNYPGYSSVTGNNAQLDGNSTIGMYKPFTAVSTGIIYASFLVRGQDFASNPSFSHFNFYSNSGGNQFNYDQGFITDDNAGNRFGIRNSSSSTQYAGTSINTNITYLVVLGYDLDSDMYSLWINPPTGQTIPPGADITFASTQPVSFIDGISMNEQCCNGYDLELGDIHVSTTWSDVVSQASTAPTTQPTNLVLTATTTSVNGNFTSASPNPDGYLVIRSTGLPPTMNPVNGLNYSIGQSIGNATVVATTCCGNFTSNSLAAGTLYYFNVYSYDDSGTIAYNMTAPLQGIVATDVSGSPSNLTFTNVSDTQMDLSWTAAGGSVSGYLVVRNTGGGSANPTNGVSYKVGDNVFGWTVVHKGSATSFTDTGLLPFTNYTYEVYAYSGVPSYENYDSNEEEDNQTTLSASPIGQPTSITFSNRTTNSMSVAFTFAAGAPSGYLIIGRPGASPIDGAPVDGTNYTSGATFSAAGSGAFIAGIGSSSFFTVTSPPLTFNTEYFFDIYSYNGSGTSRNYLQTSPLNGSAFTLTLPEPTSQPTVLTFNTITSTGFNASFTAAGGAGATGYVVLRKTSSIGDLPVDGTPYVVNDPIGTSVVAYFGTSTNFVETLLASNTTYFYKVFSYNQGVHATTVNYFTGGTPLTNSQATLVATPVATAATALAQTSFTANWGTVTGATSYRLDVATSNTFGGTIIGGYNDLTVAGISQSVTGLAAGTTYYYRVRAVGAGGTTQNSNIITVLTIPAAPTASAGTSITTTSFTANWGAVTGAVNYRLDVATSNTFGGTILGGYNNLTVAGTSQSVTGLTAGATYYYQVRASNASGVSTNSGTITVPLICLAPTANAASAFSTTGFTANWSASAGATSYRLDVATDAGFTSILGGYNDLTVAGTSQAVSGLTAGTSYHYRVRAFNASGSSVNSGTISTITLPVAPTAGAGTSMTTTSFTANWGSVTGAVNYRLDVATSNTFGGTIIAGYNDLTVAGISQSVTGLTPGATYYYQVRASNASGASVNSGTITVLLVSPAPTANAASAISTTGFTANWSAATGAASYRLDVSTDNFSTYFSTFNNMTVAGLSQAVSGATAGTTYQYRVRAFNATGTSVNSSTISTITLPAAPSATAATSVTTTSFTANWGTVTGAANYRLDVATSNTFGGTIIAGYNDLTVAGTSQSVTGLTPGATYYYQVRASNASGVSTNSGTITVPLFSVPPTANAASAISTTGFTANWSASAGATSYRLDVATDAGFTSILGSYNNLTVAGTSQAVTTLTAGTNYHYRVRAFNAAGSSLNSSTISTITIPAAPTASAGTSITTTSFTANWGAVTGAVNYRLDVATSNTFGGTIIAGYNDLTVAGISQSVTGLTPGTTYYYQVRASNASGISSNSGTITTTVLSLGPVANPASAISTTGFTASWGTVAGATSYRLDVATSNTFGGTTLAGYNDLTVAGTSQAVTGLTAGTAYYYRVRAFNAGGTSANSSTISTITLPVAPSASAGTSITTTSFTASWGAVTGAANYKLDVATSNTFGGTIIVGYNDLTVAGTSQSVTGLTPGTTYYYQVRASNASGVSVNSGTITVPLFCLAPTGNAASTFSTTGFTANWSVSTGATSYRLDVATDAGFTSILGGYNNLTVVGISQAVTGLTAGTSYHYRVRAFNAAGSSVNSSTISTITLPVAPGATAGTAMTATSFTANWGTVTGATNYKLDVATSNTFGATIVAGYNDLTVAGTSQVVSGLDPGGTYYYQVRASNASGASVNSSTITVLLLPADPVATAATSPSVTQFTANWNASNGAASYRLDVSTDNFSTYFSTYNNLTVTGVSQVVTGLTSGTTYQYRVRAVNATGTTSNSNTISIIALPPGPTANAASSVTNTSFTTSWSTTAGSDFYEVEVSTNNFSTVIPGYGTALQITSTSQVIPGLTAGATYQYHVRSHNGGGYSAYSNTISVTLLANVPVTSAANPITSTGFTANWSAATGATGYELDVSIDNFATRITGYAPLVLTNTTQAVTGLTSGSTYQYRVRATNGGGQTANSNTTSVLLYPGKPNTPSTSTIATTSFTLSWTAVPGASDYFVDVATDNAFTSLLSGFNNKPVTSGTSVVVNSLTPATAYYCRVRANNTIGAGVSSDFIKQFTIPPVPTGVAGISQSNGNSFLASWDEVSGADGYELDVSLKSDNNFTNRLPGYNPKIIVGGSTTDELVTGLTPNVYSFRVRAYILGAGTSSNSSTKTGVVDASSYKAPSISILDNSNSNTSVKANTADGKAPLTVILYHKKISDATFVQDAPVAVSGNSVTISIDNTFMDEIGMEYYFTVTDDTERTVASPTHAFVYKTISSAPVITLEQAVGGTLESYRIFSIPLDLASPNVSDVFKDVIALYSGVVNAKTRWRLVHYESGKNLDYPENFSTIEKGKGYWFNAKDPVSIKVSGSTGGLKPINQSAPFELQLNKGWNQIGDPFTFDVSWADVLAKNPGVTGVGKLFTYVTSPQVGIKEDDVLKAWGGGFVKADQAVKLIIPVTVKHASGRVGVETQQSDLSQNDWFLPLTLSQGDLFNSMGGIGMNIEAKDGNDRFDEQSLPRFIKYLEFNSYHPEYFLPRFTRDVVPTALSHNWNFVVESNLEEKEAILTWDNQSLGNNAAQLLLYDVDENAFVDMKKNNSYRFSLKGKHSFKIFYGADEKSLMPDVMSLGRPYPNPSSASVTIPFITAGDNSNVEIAVYDIMGKRVKMVANGVFEPGLHEATWDGNDEQGGTAARGVYIYRLTNANTPAQQGRIVLK